MADTITVKAGPKVEAGRVAIWERDEAHPDGEIYLAKAHEGEEDQQIEVAETAGIIVALGEGRLMRVERRRAAPVAAMTTTTPTGNVLETPGLLTEAQRKALADAGINTAADVRAVDDAALESVEGIGPATTARLREATKG